MKLHFTPAKEISKNPTSVISVIFNVALMPDLTVYGKASVQLSVFGSVIAFERS